MLIDRELSTKVTEEDIPDMVKDEFGAFYTPDGKRLLKGVDSDFYCIKPGTQVICEYAFEKAFWLPGFRVADSEDDTVIKSEDLISIAISELVTLIGYCAFFPAKLGLTLMKNNKRHEMLQKNVSLQGRCIRIVE